jgi:hypothetical protein
MSAAVSSIPAAAGDRLSDDARPALAGAVGPDAAPELVGGGQQCRSASEEEAAGVGELELVRGPVQQLDTELRSTCLT